MKDPDAICVKFGNAGHCRWRHGTVLEKEIGRAGEGRNHDESKPTVELPL